MSTFFSSISLFSGLHSEPTQPEQGAEGRFVAIEKKIKNILNQVKNWLIPEEEHPTHRRLATVAAPTQSAIHTMLGNDNFKNIKKAFFSPDKPKGPIKERCKAAANKLLQNINVEGLDATSFRNLQRLVKHSIYRLVQREGENALLKSSHELADIWKNCNPYGFIEGMDDLVHELRNRITINQRHEVINPENVFKAAVQHIASRCNKDRLGIGLRVQIFQQNLEHLRNKPRMSEQEYAKNIDEYLKRVNDIELPEDLKAFVVQKSQEKLQHLPLHLQQQYLFKMQDCLLKSAKIALLSSVVNEGFGSFTNIEDVFREIAPWHLIQIASGNHPKCLRRASFNHQLTVMAQEAGLKAVSRLQNWWNAFKGIGDTHVAIPVGHGRVEYYEANSVRTLMRRHEIAIGDREKDPRITETREILMRKMLKDEAMLTLAKQLVPQERIYRQTMIMRRHSTRQLNPESEKAYKMTLKHDLISDEYEKLTEWDQRCPRALDENPEYSAIMDNLLKKYSPEAVQNDNKKYKRVMEYLGAIDIQHRTNSLVSSGACASILHSLA